MLFYFLFQDIIRLVVIHRQFLFISLGEAHNIIFYCCDDPDVESRHADAVLLKNLLASFNFLVKVFEFR